VPLQPLTSIDALSILHETRKIWSAGLRIEDYYDFNDMQRHDTWGRRNLQLFGYTTEKGEIAASCKLYKLTMTSGPKDYPCYGVGAIFSRNKFRGQGFGGKIVQAVIQKAKRDKQAGLLLFSDIGEAFYEQYGFNEIGSIEMTVVVDREQTDQDKLSGVDYHVIPFHLANFDLLDRHHRRWLRRRPFGVSRSLDYFAYKARKEDFLNRHSTLSWPMLQLIMVEDGQGNLSYAVYEIGGPNLRVLELVSAAPLVETIWRAVFIEALKHNCRQIKSWESNILELCPGFSLKSFLNGIVYKKDFAPTIYYSQRSWGKVMLLPLENEIRPWLRSFPSPILELDHL